MRAEEAFPAIVSKAQFRRVNSRMRSRASKTTHPRRIASSYLLSGLVKCYRCETLLSGQDAARLRNAALILLRPNGTNPQYAWEGLTIRVTWDAVEGADYYKVYHDDVTDSACSLDIFDGSPKFCEELAADVAGTTFVHTNPALDANYYWVVACNQEGCSEIDSSNPASPLGDGSGGPTSGGPCRVRQRMLTMI